MGRCGELRTLFFPEYEPQHRLAMILIAILLERTDAGELFPGEIKAYPTAEFDSLFAGVDCVLEFRRGDRTALHLGLCMEAVVEGEDVWDPFDETREELERDALASVTYFHSEWLNFMGTITLPRLLVALDAKSIADMLKPWQEQTGWFPGSQGRATIVQSILAQLAVQEAFAERAGAPQSLARLREVRSELHGRLTSLATQPETSGEWPEAAPAGIHRRLLEVFS